MSNDKVEIKPFLKWAGGKSQLLPAIESVLPTQIKETKTIDKYFEPFVGGGAMLFFMLQKFPNIKRVMINDINVNLTEAYKNIKYYPDELVLKLKDIEKEYLNITNEDSRKDFYLRMRTLFNNKDITSIEKTMLLIFLNRTCFNGLYRENSKGEFNVPFGKYSNPTICNEDVIYADSELLNKFDVEINNGDFEIMTDDNNLTFYYFDPPYRPLNATSSFNDYTKEAFNDLAQQRLKEFCDQVQAAGYRFMLSNSDCKDGFFDDLYIKYQIERVWASRNINANPHKRGKLTELLIRNYA
jgi:DNA adenine methylase